MRTILFLVVLGACALVNSQKYTNRYDTINLDEVFANKRLMVAYIKCMLESGRCTPEGKELKSHITEALQNGCAKCTGAQREGSHRVIKHLIRNENDYWRQLVKKYDPKGVYSKKYENLLNKYE